jgi:predicted DNA-binding transcriptional regulator AlpA
MTARIRFLSPKQVMELTSLSRRTLGRVPDFPKPVPIYEGSTRLGYIESDVLAWLEARVEQLLGPPVGTEPDRPEPSPGASGKNGHGGRRPDHPQAERRRPPRKAHPPPRGSQRPGQGRPII